MAVFAEKPAGKLRWDLQQLSWVMGVGECKYCVSQVSLIWLLRVSWGYLNASHCHITHLHIGIYRPVYSFTAKYFLCGKCYKYIPGLQKNSKMFTDTVSLKHALWCQFVNALMIGWFVSFAAPSSWIHFIFKSCIYCGIYKSCGISQLSLQDVVR